MNFGNRNGIFQDYQTIKDEKQMLLDKLYIDEKRRRHHAINPFHKQ